MICICLADIVYFTFSCHFLHDIMQDNHNVQPFPIYFHLACLGSKAGEKIYMGPS